MRRRAKVSPASWCSPTGAFTPVVTASRKVGGSVLRNRVKRCIRAAFRAERDVLPRGSDVVVIARQGAGALGGNEVAAELATLFRGGASR